MAMQSPYRINANALPMIVATKLGVSEGDCLPVTT